MDYSTIVTQISAIRTCKNDLGTALTSAGAHAVKDLTFRGFANAVYNLGLDTTTKIITDTSIDTRSKTQEEIVEAQLRYLLASRIWIKTAFRLRGVDVEKDNFSDYDDLVAKVNAASVQNKYMTITTSAGLVEHGTVLTISNNTLASGEAYYYKVSNTIPILGNTLDTTGWTVINSGDEILTTNESFICVVDINTTSKKVINAGIVQAVTKELGIASNLSITSAAGTKYSHTALTVSPSLVSGDKYYYKVYASEYYKQNAAFDSTGYTEWDGTSEIKFTDTTSAIVLVEVDAATTVVAYGLFTPVTKAIPSSFAVLYITSAASITVGYTTITISNLVSGDLYYYKENGSATDIENFESFDNTGWTAWDGKTEIAATTGTVLYFLDVSTAAVVQKGASVSVIANDPVTNTLTITSTASTTTNGCTALTVMPAIGEGNLYLYQTGVSTYSLPTYHSTFSGTSWDGKSELSIANGTRILLAEVTSNSLVVKAGYCTVVSKVAYLENLVLTSVEGSTSLKTAITVSPTIISGNHYRYKAGLASLNYGDNVSSWTYWNGTDEIYGFADGSRITIVEANSSYQAQKAGYIGVNSKDEYLEQLTLTSTRGSVAGYTRIFISPAKVVSTRVYKYFYNPTTIPTLNTDLSDWNDFNTSGDSITGVDGDTLYLAETNEYYQCKKLGYVAVNVKEAPAVLGVLTLTSTASATAGNTIITVSPAKEDGYIYKYAVTTTIPTEYHADVSSWTTWNGTSEITAAKDSTLVMAIATTDGKAVSIGSIKVVATATTGVTFTTIESDIAGLNGADESAVVSTSVDNNKPLIVDHTTHIAQAATIVEDGTGVNAVIEVKGSGTALYLVDSSIEDKAEGIHNISVSDNGTAYVADSIISNYGEARDVVNVKSGDFYGYNTIFGKEYPEYNVLATEEGVGSNVVLDNCAIDNEGVSSAPAISNNSGNIILINSAITTVDGSFTNSTSGITEFHNCKLNCDTDRERTGFTFLNTSGKFTYAKLEIIGGSLNATSKNLISITGAIDTEIVFSDVAINQNIPYYFKMYGYRTNIASHKLTLDHQKLYLNIYNSDLMAISVVNESIFRGSVIGEGATNISIDNNSTWIVSADSKVGNLYSLGKIEDINHNPVSIVSDTTIYRKGSSDYTIHVDTYKEEFNNDNTIIPDEADYFRVDRPEVF